MDKYEFQQFLYKKIPITKAMEFNVLEFTPWKVRISANFAPNINHKSTAFGGSINSLMTICGWALTFINIKDVDLKAHIVIQKSSINYSAPIKGDFTAECALDNEEQKEKFLSMYNRHKKGRLTLDVYCNDKDKVLAKYNGTYVAFK